MDIVTLHPIPIILLCVRIIFGIILIYYGWPKIKDLRKNARDFVDMGFKPGWFWGTIVAAVEFVGGIAILLGIYVWVAGVLVAIHMTTGALWKITKTDKGFTDYSYDMLMLSVALLLSLTGPGYYSLSRLVL